MENTPDQGVSRARDDARPDSSATDLENPKTPTAAGKPIRPESPDSSKSARPNEEKNEKDAEPDDVSDEDTEDEGDDDDEDEDDDTENSSDDDVKDPEVVPKGEKSSQESRNNTTNR